MVINNIKMKLINTFILAKESTLVNTTDQPQCTLDSVNDYEQGYLYI